MPSRGAGQQGADTPFPGGAIFVLPLAVPSAGAPVAAWATTGGWAQGAEEVLGEAWVLSDSGWMTPSEASAHVTSGGWSRPRGTERLRRRLPEAPITLVKDVRKAWTARRTRRVCTSDLPVQPAFVWQRHELFRRDGLELARKLGVPYVLSVHALQVEEAAGWGVRRPAWGPLAERLGELPQLRAADLVACVSTPLAQAVTRRGIAPEKIVVTPNGVDTNHFYPRQDGVVSRDELELEETAFVVVWSGSFRRFHGLELALDAIAELRTHHPDVRLLLIGDGLERPAIEREAWERGLTSVRFAGPVTRSEMPYYLSLADAGLIVSGGGSSFHYSPVKLKEYMACGLPVIAPAVGDLRTELINEHNALVTEPADSSSVAEAIGRLKADARLRHRIAAAGLREVQERWSWPKQVERLLECLPRPTRE